MLPSNIKKSEIFCLNWIEKSRSSITIKNSMFISYFKFYFKFINENLTIDHITDCQLIVRRDFFKRLLNFQFFLITLYSQSL